MLSGPFLSISLFSIPCSLFPVLYSLFPIPCSLFPVPFFRFPVLLSSTYEFFWL
jgi:hypothetical protein